MWGRCVCPAVFVLLYVLLLLLLVLLPVPAGRMFGCGCAAAAAACSMCHASCACMLPLVCFSNQPSRSAPDGLAILQRQLPRPAPSGSCLLLSSQLTQPCLDTNRLRSASSKGALLVAVP